MRGRSQRRVRGAVFASRLFKRLFFSYVAIISAAFLFYTLFVVLESTIQRKADAERRSQLKLQEAANVMESQLLEARTVVSRVKSSLIIRDLYLSLKNVGRAVDITTLYQSIQELKSARASASNTGIYDILLFLSGDRRAYSSVDVTLLPEPFTRGTDASVTVFRGSLRDHYGLAGVDDLRLYKQFVVYAEDYSYDAALAHGVVAVLFDVNTLATKIAGLDGGGAGFVVRADGEAILGAPLRSGKVFTLASNFAPGVLYELMEKGGGIATSIGAATVVALLLGLVVGAGFLLAAYYFSRSYYRPIGTISRLLGAGDGDTEKLDEIAAGISTLMDEREGYRKAAISALPFVRQAALHALLTGNLGAEEIDFLVRDSGLPLQRRFFLVAVCNIGFRGAPSGEQAGSTAVRAAIVEAARQCTRNGVEVLCYEKDSVTIALLVCADDAESPVDAVYELHERASQATAHSPFVVTVGADEAREDRTLIPRAFRNATRALDGILLGGRGGVFFYDPESEAQDAGYWFPADAQVRLGRALAAAVMPAIASFLDEVAARNTPRSPGIGHGARLMLYELYVVTVRIFGKAGLLPSLTVNVERTVAFTTIEEVLQYYRSLYEEACSRIAADTSASQLDERVLAYVAEACFEPGVALKNVADTFGVSMKRVEDLLHERMHASFSRFVHDRRIERAVELLRDPSLTLEAIGTRCGYTSILTFRRRFQKATGVNPSDFRREALARNGGSPRA